MLKLWQGKELEKIEYREKLMFGKNLQEAIGMTKLGEKHVMLCVGGYDINIHVYLVPRIEYQNQEDKIFKYKFSLLGHLNALRYFSFSPLLENSV